MAWKRSRIVASIATPVLLLLSTNAFGWTQQEIENASANVEPKVIEWRRKIHQNPELANREVETSKLVADHLRSLGIEVKTNVGVHGVVGVLKGGKPGDKVVGLRADMDANAIKELTDLPFKSTKVDHEWPEGPTHVMHACGHDAHTAMLMGAAEVLSGMREDLPGSVKFLFQGAEEGPPADEVGGAGLMIKEGAFENPRPEMVFGIHIGPMPNNVVTYTPGRALANSYKISIKIIGNGSHAATPWRGKDPMPVAAEIVNALAQVYRQVPATEVFSLSIGEIVSQGRFNIIGNDVSLVGTLRVINEELLEDIKIRVDRIATNIAEAHGLTAEVQWDQFVPGLINGPKWVARMKPTIERIVGADNIVEVPPTLGYDDISEFINPVGGMYVFLGAQDSLLGGPLMVRPKPGGKGLYFNHNPRFYINEEVLVTGVKLHVNMALDYLDGNMQ